MAAGLCLVADTEARDHCVVVVKGTFVADRKGILSLHSEQEPVVHADEHYGDPETTPVRRECEFALRKPVVDVLVDGFAIPPGGKQVRDLSVALELGGKKKVAVVYGDRRWIRTAGSLAPSSPALFDSVPLTFDRAFGGIDDSKGPGAGKAERRNLCGVGFHPNRPQAEVEALPVPNLQRPGEPISSPRQRLTPIGFGCIGRAWTPRVDHAGTYGQAWLDNVAPFLPPDFDERYYQCAPLDQQLPRLAGGEVIRCVHMNEEHPVVSYVVPSGGVPVGFEFVDERRRANGVLDTVILQPHLRLAHLIWRASTPMGKRIHDLHGIRVGPTPTDAEGLQGYRAGKPVFRSLGEAVRWLAKHRRN